jgi:hypothetical protein
MFLSLEHVTNPGPIRTGSMFTRSLLVLLTFVPALFAWSQGPVRITDGSSLFLPSAPEQSGPLAAGLQAAGLAAEQVERIANLSDPGLWPAGLATDSARQANRSALANIVAYRIAEYPMEQGLVAVVHVPAAENYHMNEELRAPNDLYLLMPAGAIMDAEPVVAVEPPSKGPAWQRMPQARILKPDDVYATYDLSSDSMALALMEKKGFSKAEIDAVIFRSHERNWPQAISRFDHRYPRLTNFKRYKAYSAGTWDGKVLVVIPAAANKKAEESMRPYLDIYMVYAANAVSVKEVRKKR